MADKLTIDTNIPSVQPLAGQQDAPPDSPELAALREEMQARTGSRLEDHVLRGILGHRAAAAENQAKLAETKADYEATASQEQLTTGDSGAADIRRAIGADSAKGLDQLTEREREQIRSLKSGAILPPLAPGLEPITSDAAQELSLKILNNQLGDITVDGQSFESAPELLAAYQASLSTAPSAKKKVTPSMGARVGVAKPSVGAPVMGATPAALSMKVGGSQVGSNTAGRSGGGLDRGSVAFADSSWNTFLWSFMQRSISDDQSWRKMMKTMRQLDGELKIGFKKLEQVLTEFKHQSEQFEKGLAAAKSGWQVSDEVIQSRADSLVGKDPTHAGAKDLHPDSHEKAASSANSLIELDSQLEELAAKAVGSPTDSGPVAEGEVRIRMKGQSKPRRFLTPSELSRLSPEDQKSYQTIRDMRTYRGGLNGDLAAMRLEAIERGIVEQTEQSPKGGGVEIQEEGTASLGGKSVVTDPEFAQMLKEAEAKVDTQVAILSRDIRGYGALVTARNSLRGQNNELRKEFDAAKKAKDEAPDDAKAQETYDTVARQLAINCDALATLDQKMLPARPGADDFLGKEQANTQKWISELDANKEKKAELEKQRDSLKPDGKMPWPMTSARKELSKVEEDLQDLEMQIRRAEQGPNFLDKMDIFTGDAQMDSLGGAGTTYEERISAFSNVSSVAAELHRDQKDLYTNFRGVHHTAGLANMFIDPVTRTEERSAMKHIQSAGGAIGGEGKRAHGQLQSQLGKIRNLVDQLIQLTKV